MFELVYPYGDAPVLPRPSVDTPGVSSDAGVEWLPVTDSSGIVSARATRAYCHSGSALLHPVVHLHIIDRQGRITLQKRSRTKDLHPGKWDTAVGGHVSYGEGILEALYRETAEELGLTAFNPVYLETYVYEAGGDRELVSVYAAVGEYVLTPRDGEVEQLRKWTEQEILEAGGKGIMTPNFEQEFQRIRQKLFAML